MNNKRKSSETADPVSDFEKWCFRICGVFRLTDELLHSVKNVTRDVHAASPPNVCAVA